MEVFDIHQHVPSAKLAKGKAAFSADYEMRVRFMDENGIGRAALMPSFDYVMPHGIEDTMRVNDQVAEYRSKYSDRFPIAIGTVEPRHGEASLDEIDRIVKDLGLRGIVWHHKFQGITIDDGIMRLYLEKVATLDIPVFIHLFGEASTEAPWMLENLLDEFPQITFVALDGFSTLDRGRQLAAVARRHSNVIFDNALMLSYSRVGESFVKSVGSERLCFGSDLYFDTMFYRQVSWLHAIKEYVISEKDKHNIYAGNAVKLFRLPPGK